VLDEHIDFIVDRVRGPDLAWPGFYQAQVNWPPGAQEFREDYPLE
jgi:hypothetical protein